MERVPTARIVGRAGIITKPPQHGRGQCLQPSGQHGAGFGVSWRNPSSRLVDGHVHPDRAVEQPSATVALTARAGSFAGSFKNEQAEPETWLVSTRTANTSAITLLIGSGVNPMRCSWLDSSALEDRAGRTRIEDGPLDVECQARGRRASFSMRARIEKPLSVPKRRPLSEEASALHSDLLLDFHRPTRANAAPQCFPKHLRRRRINSSSVTTRTCSGNASTVCSTRAIGSPDHGCTLTML